MRDSIGDFRATLDLKAADFAAFRALSALPTGMPADVVFNALVPVAPATTSTRIVEDVIRLPGRVAQGLA